MTWYSEHREEALARSAAWQMAHPDSHRRSKRKTRGVVNPTGEIKTGPCESCGNIEKLCLDHDHVTKEPRGWLCRRCNLALGWWEMVLREGLDEKFCHYLQNLNPPIQKDVEIPSLDELLRLRKEGYTWKRLAEHYDVMPKTVMRWVRKHGVELKRFKKYIPSEWVTGHSLPI